MECHRPEFSPISDSDKEDTAQQWMQILLEFWCQENARND
jgi:hypothetical protein